MPLNLLTRLRSWKNSSLVQESYCCFCQLLASSFGLLVMWRRFEWQQDSRFAAWYYQLEPGLEYWLMWLGFFASSLSCSNVLWGAPAAWFSRCPVHHNHPFTRTLLTSTRAESATWPFPSGRGNLWYVQNQKVYQRPPSKESSQNILPWISLIDLTTYSFYYYCYHHQQQQHHRRRRRRSRRHHHHHHHRSRYSDETTGWIKEFFCPPKRPDRLRVPLSLLFTGRRSFFSRGGGYSGLSVKLTVDLHLVWRLRMRESTTGLCFSYFFMTWTRTNYYYYYYLHHYYYHHHHHSHHLI